MFAAMLPALFGSLDPAQPTTPTASQSTSAKPESPALSIPPSIPRITSHPMSPRVQAARQMSPSSVVAQPMSPRQQMSPFTSMAQPMSPRSSDAAQQSPRTLTSQGSPGTAVRVGFSWTADLPQTVTTHVSGSSGVHAWTTTTASGTDAGVVAREQTGGLVPMTVVAPAVYVTPGGGGGGGGAATPAAAQQAATPSLAPATPVSVASVAPRAADAAPTPSAFAWSAPVLAEDGAPKEAARGLPRPPGRGGVRLLVLGPGRERGLEQAGFQLHFCGAPNPESPGLCPTSFLPQVKAELDKFQPDAVVAFSFGGAYLALLWQRGYWRGPSVILSAHPSCQTLPPDVSVVVVHGSNDEKYPRTRESLEQLVSTAGQNRAFLVYTANSGRQTSGHYSRVGDRHSLDSVRHHDCLARLVDAALNAKGPEMHFLRTCRERLQVARLEAEARLGYTPAELRRSWASGGRGGMDDEKLFDVPAGSEEFDLVNTVFKAQPVERAIYQLKPQQVWDATSVVRVQRVENSFQEEGSARPYFDALRTSIEGQGVEFEPGTHTCWGFHGASLDAIESIISDPVAGFQPLASGTKKASLWGAGTYFARDARYVAEGGFCAAPAADGTQQMLMCLLVIGVPCLGGPEQHGVLPFRRKPHRYNSSVDCLASPEVYVIQHPGGAYPAYVVTFKAPSSP